MRKFVVATRNKGKMKEIDEILSSLPLQVISMEEAGIGKDIEETGSTFEENAMIKALEIYRLTGEIVMADDSGLAVDHLGGAPGIYSARFGGEGATDEDKYNKLLGMLQNIPGEKRTARFICAIAVVINEEEKFTVRGTCEGLVGFQPQGSNGFGYDPIFYLPEFERTMAQLSPEEKNRISHRGRALQLMVEELKRYINLDTNR
jgi:XTP/dITP diphosphohydrolase